MKSKNDNSAIRKAGNHCRCAALVPIHWNIPPRHSVALFSHHAAHRLEADWGKPYSGTYHLHPPTIKSLCVFVRVHVRVWLSAMSRCSHHREFLRIHNNPSITGITLSTFLSLFLRNISGGRIYFSGRPFLIGSLGLQWAWKVAVAQQGRYFHLMKPKINRTSLFSYIVYVHKGNKVLYFILNCIMDIILYLILSSIPHLLQRENISSDGVPIFQKKDIKVKTLTPKDWGKIGLYLPEQWQ